MVRTIFEVARVIREELTRVDPAELLEALTLIDNADDPPPKARCPRCVRRSLRIWQRRRGTIGWSCDRGQCGSGGDALDLIGAVLRLPTKGPGFVRVLAAAARLLGRTDLECDVTASGETASMIALRPLRRSACPAHRVGTARCVLLTSVRSKAGHASGAYLDERVAK